MIETRDTATYPTRYEAFDHPREWCRFTGDKDGALEAAVYHEPMINMRWPHITDGIYCEIRRMPDNKMTRRFLVDGQASLPNTSREQRGILQTVYIRHAGDEDRAFTEALEIAQKWIDATRAWIKRTA